MTIVDTESPPQYHVLDHLNLSAEVLAETVIHVNWAEVDKTYVPGIKASAEFPTKYLRISYSGHLRTRGGSRGKPAPSSSPSVQQS